LAACPQRRFQILLRLVVQPEQVVVAMADDPVLLDHDDGPLGAEATVRAVEHGNRPIYVREQRHTETVLRDEVLMRVHVLY
jgi:hypothetical protein